MYLFRNPATLLSAVVALFVVSVQRSDAALTIAFSQVGANTVVTATGTLNLAGMSWTDRVEPGPVPGTPLLYQQIAGNLPQDIVRLLSTSYAIYRMPVATSFFTAQFGVLVATQSSGQTFGIWANNNETCLFVPARFSSGSLSGSMVFENVNLGSLGIVEQDINFGMTDDKKVRLVVVPEVSCLLLLGFGGAGCVFRRSRGAVSCSLAATP